MANRTYRALVVTMLTALSGCSPGLVGIRAFTPDSRYLVWQDIHYCYLPPVIAFEVKRTDCQTGHTRLLGRGDFVLDSSGKYAVLYPASDWPGNATIVRLDDARLRLLPPAPSGTGFYSPEWLDVTVAAFDPPDLSALLVSTVDRQFQRCRFTAEKWTVVEEGTANGQLLARAEAIQQQTAFTNTQVTSKVKKTVSPNGEYVLTESMAEPVHCSRLEAGKRSVILSIQTDQLAAGLRRTGEFFAYRGK
jgi:hypothetical protein